MAYTADIYYDVIRKMYVDQGMSLRKVARVLRTEFSCPASANMIADVLNAHGVSTAKSSVTGCHRLVVCRTCGRPKEIARSRYVSSLGRGPSAHRPRAHYCDWDCRRVWLEEHCKGQEAARRLVEYLMDADLPPDAVCHFVDDNTSNVIKQNIRVFTNTKRHLEEHRKEKEK